ncbi:RHS repeat-associated core domain-containing protein, partial [Cytophagales bacterium LB-30]
TLNQSYPTGATDANKVLSATYYDDYSQQATWGAGFAFVPEMGHTAASQNTRVKGLVTGSLTQVLGSSPVQWLKSVTYYDSKYRPIQTITENHLGGTDRVTTTYDFIGQATATQRTHTASGQPTLVLKERFDYDHAGRLLRHYHQVGAQAEVLLAEHSYNELGQLVEKDLHSENNGGSHLQSVDYRYNIRGWLGSINNHNFSNDAGATNNDTNDLFGMTLRYNTGLSTGAGTAQYNGNIGEIIWREKQSNKLQGYGFSYDAMNRLTSANYRHYSNSSWTGSAENNRFNESISLYDKNGNIKALSRNSEIGAMDILEYVYKGNQLVGVHDTGNAAQGFVNGSTSTSAIEYTYDANGNMDYDANKRIRVSYNHLNLPSFVDILPSGAPLEHQVRYTYNASGQKLRKVDDVAGNLTSTDYIGGIHYENNLLTFVQTAEGRVRKDGTSWVYEYNLTDHLGNVRVSFDKNPSTGVARLIQKDDYYPFGGTFGSYTSGTENLYKYNGKEEQKELGTLDYGWRQYDPWLGRFNVVDAYADKYFSMSPYQYAANNPMLFVDVNGDSIDVSGILADKDLAKVFSAFFNTKTGKAFIGQFAAKGQSVLGHTFEEDGAYHSAGIDLAVNAKSLGKDSDSPNGQTDAKEDGDRLKLTIDINTDINADGGVVEAYGEAMTSYKNRSLSESEALQAKREFLAERGKTLTHESFIHVYHFSNNYVNGVRGRLGLNAAGGYKNHHYYEYYNKGNTKFSTDGIRVILSIHNQFKTGKSAAEINESAHDYSLR